MLRPATIGAEIVIVAAGVNREDGDATGRNDVHGRRVAIPANARAYPQMIPPIVGGARRLDLLALRDEERTVFATVAEVLRNAGQRASGPDQEAIDRAKIGIALTRRARDDALIDSNDHGGLVLRESPALPNRPHERRGPRHDDPPRR